MRRESIAYLHQTLNFTADCWLLRGVSQLESLTCTNPYFSPQTAGYRDVSINLRVVNDVSLDLGLEARVCELKLILTEFAEIKVRREDTLIMVRMSIHLWGRC